MIQKVISGGQTGADRAGLDAAKKHDISRGGWCPKGRSSEAGPIPDSYPLEETPSPEPRQRTEWNVRDSDGTLIISSLPLKGGTAYTAKTAKILKKPALVVDAEAPIQSNVKKIKKWITKSQIQILNVAGPRASEYKQSYSKTKKILEAVFELILR